MNVRGGAWLIVLAVSCDDGDTSDAIDAGETFHRDGYFGSCRVGERGVQPEHAGISRAPAPNAAVAFDRARRAIARRDRGYAAANRADAAEPRLARGFGSTTRLTQPAARDAEGRVGRILEQRVDVVRRELVGLPPDPEQRVVRRGCRERGDHGRPEDAHAEDADDHFHDEQRRRERERTEHAIG